MVELMVKAEKPNIDFRERCHELEAKIKELEQQLKAERSESLVTEKELFRNEKQLAETKEEFEKLKDKCFEKELYWKAEADNIVKAKIAKLIKAVLELHTLSETSDEYYSVEWIDRKEVLELIKGMGR
jgi:hypothetical protein